MHTKSLMITFKSVNKGSFVEECANQHGLKQLWNHVLVYSVREYSSPTGAKGCNTKQSLSKCGAVPGDK